MCPNYNQFPYINNIPQNNFMPNGFNMNNFNPNNFNMNNFSQNSGITSRPIDENTIKELQNNMLTSEILPDISEELSVFIQNERNGSIFYKYLSNISYKEKNKDILLRISNNCLSEIKKYNEIYREIKNKDFEIQESKINEKIDLKGGINWALEEECKGIELLTEIYDKINKIDIKEKIFYSISMKISRIGFLQIFLNE